MQMKFSCGHEGETPRDMGRGRARQLRLVCYFDRLCPECHRAKWTAFFAGDHHITGRVYTADEQARAVERMMTSWECQTRRIVQFYRS